MGAANMQVGFDQAVGNQKDGSVFGKIGCMC